MFNIYLKLTNRFNEGKLRSVLSSGQAIVVHGLALSSKDGDWIVREDDESLDFILGILEDYGATYRLGAPLDARWMQGGWSAHFEFNFNGSRTRTDFVTRPPRVSDEDLGQMWQEQQRASEFPVPTLDLQRLARLKLTQREKDYAFVAEIARRLSSPREQLLWSRSARDLLRLNAENAGLTEELSEHRPVLSQISRGRDALETALDMERRQLLRADETRLEKYAMAAQEWTRNWPKLKAEIAGLSLRAAHKIIVEHAQILPQKVI